MYMSERIGSQLKQTRDQLTPDRSWVSTNRESLMRSVHADMAKTASANSQHSAFQGLLHQIMPAQFATMARSAMALLLAITVTTGGWIATVAASAESLPGEKLHTVKLATEGVELAVSKVLGSDEDEVATKLKHAANRAKEYQKSPKPEQKQQAIQALKKTIESSKETLEDVEPKKAVAVAKVMGEKTEEILTELSNAKKEQKEKEKIEETPTASETEQDDTDTAEEEKSKQLDAEVAEVEELIEQASVKAIAVLLEESTKEESEVSPEEVKVVVEKKVARLTSELTEINEELKDTVEQASAGKEQNDVRELVNTVDAVLASVSSTTTTSTTPVQAATTTAKPATTSTTVSTTLPVATALQGTTSTEVREESGEVIADVEALIKQKDTTGIIALLESLTQQKQQAVYSVAEIKEALNALLKKETEELRDIGESLDLEEKTIPEESEIADSEENESEESEPAAEEPNNQP